jgi:N-methylhydantoinase B
MKTFFALAFCAASPVLAETCPPAPDFSCAVFDADGNMLVQAAHIPVHLGSQPMSVRAAMQAALPRSGVDVILNDPFAGGTHLPDVTLVKPVFLPGDPKPAYFVSNRAHHADVGGLTPGSMPAGVRGVTIDDEGFRLPPTELTAEVRAQFAAASRTPEERYGDLRAQEAANTVGCRRLAELIASVGPERTRELNAALLDYSERRMRRIIESLGDGVYEHTDYLDDDGAGIDPVPIPVQVTIDGDRAVVDFSAAPDAVTGPMNTVRAICVSAVFYVFRCLGGEEVPANAGLLRPIQIITRRGSICDAQPPAAVSAGNVETSQRLVDALLGALASAAPDRIPAASCGTMNNVLLGGTDPRPGPRQGQAFVHYETIGGGAGGSPRGPGADAIHTHMTNTLNTPVEELERSFPVRIREYSVRPGRQEPPHHGGAGVVRSYEFLADAEVTLISERRRLAPWGLGGGDAGEPGRNSLRRANGATESLAGKARVRVAAGDVLVVETPGGGDWGGPS